MMKFWFFYCAILIVVLLTAVSGKTTRNEEKRNEDTSSEETTTTTKKPGMISRLRNYVKGKLGFTSTSTTTPEPEPTRGLKLKRTTLEPEQYDGDSGVENGHLYEGNLVARPDAQLRSLSQPWTRSQIPSQFQQQTPTPYTSYPTAQPQQQIPTSYTSYPAEQSQQQTPTPYTSYSAPQPQQPNPYYYPIQQPVPPAPQQEPATPLLPPVIPQTLPVIPQVQPAIPQLQTAIPQVQPVILQPQPAIPQLPPGIPQPQPPTPYLYYSTLPPVSSTSYTPSNAQTGSSEHPSRLLLATAPPYIIYYPQTPISTPSTMATTTATAATTTTTAAATTVESLDTWSQWSPFGMMSPWGNELKGNKNKASFSSLWGQLGQSPWGGGMFGSMNPFAGIGGSRINNDTTSLANRDPFGGASSLFGGFG